MIRGLADKLVGESNIDLPSASLFVQHFARIQYASTDRYDLGTDFGDCCWGDFFSLTGDPPNGVFVLAQHMLDGAAELGNANQTAVAKILRGLCCSQPHRPVRRRALFRRREGRC